MRTPYLIQRGNFQDRPYKTGIDRILKFDYMGSSEFEWGALGTSLKRIRENIEEYTLALVDITTADGVDYKINVFCKAADLAQVIELIKNIGDREYHTKEYTDFDNYLYPDRAFECRTDHWWDIENDYMFWKKDKQFTKKFTTLFFSGEK